MEKLIKENLYRHIHRGLHNARQSVIVINNEHYPIGLIKGLRHIRYRDTVFCQHSTVQKTALAVRARSERITRIMRTGGRWGWISDTEIADPNAK